MLGTGRGKMSTKAGVRLMASQSDSSPLKGDPHLMALKIASLSVLTSNRCPRGLCPLQALVAHRGHAQTSPHVGPWLIACLSIPPKKDARLAPCQRLAVLPSDRTNLVHSILRMWKYLVEYRLYTASEMENLLECLVDLLEDEVC